MITQIEIDGFKTFKDFKVELAPFQVLVGPNGSGKSNLFDALRLLSRLAETDLLSALQELRGDADELFTKLPEGKTTDRIRLAVEMLIDRKAQDTLGAVLEPIGKDVQKRQTELKYTRLRYELEIMLRTDEYGLERLYLTHESLSAIPGEKDNWCKKYKLSSQNGWLPEATGDEAVFIGTGRFQKAIDGSDIVDMHTPIITIYREDQTKGNPLQFRAEDLQSTILNTIISTEYVSMSAARAEMRSWKFFHLNPEVLRQPSSTKAPRVLSPDGRNMPTTLARIQAEDSFALHGVSIDMANLVPGILDIRVEQDKLSDRYVVYAETSDQRTFSSQVLSDGTLRLLALATLRNDPQFHGVLCIEEPENGVHPLHLKNMTRLLHEMATDFNDPQQVNEPLRQVLVTTHSPLFISQPDVIDSLLLTIMPTHIYDKSTPASRVTRMVPVITPNTPSPFETDTNGDKAIEAYTIDMVRKYLDSDSLDEAEVLLKKARMSLHER